MNGGIEWEAFLKETKFFRLFVSFLLEFVRQTSRVEWSGVAASTDLYYKTFYTSPSPLDSSVELIQK